MDDKIVNTVFLDAKTNLKIDDLPDEFDKEELVVGNKIRIHLFAGGWQIYKIKQIEEGKPCKVYVKKVWF